MKSIKRVSIVVMLACLGQVARSDDQKQTSNLVLDKEAIYKICKSLPATVRLKQMLVGDKRYYCDSLVDSYGKINEDLVKELMDSRKTPLSEDITQTPSYQRKQALYDKWTAEGPEWIGDHDASDMANRMRDMRMMQQLYSSYIHPYFSKQGPAEAMCTFLDWSNNYHN
jgi:hypothetical protein